MKNDIAEMNFQKFRDKFVTRKPFVANNFRDKNYHGNVLIASSEFPAFTWA